MPRYSPERKAALLKKLLPPLNLSVAEVARQEGISEVTLYAWRKQAKTEGAVVPGDKKLPDDWPAEAKFAVVLETAALSEIAAFFKVVVASTVFLCRLFQRGLQGKRMKPPVMARHTGRFEIFNVHRLA